MHSSSRVSKNKKDRREFLKNGMVAAGAATLGTGLLASGPSALAAQQDEKSGKLPKGDAAILRFLAAAEILETDLWVQYNELGGYAQAFRGYQFPGFHASSDDWIR